MKTLLEALNRTAADNEAVFCHFLQSGKETSIRWADLQREARRYARFFRSNGVQPGEVILIILQHSPDLLYSFLGAMLAGAIPAFMPPCTSKQHPRLYWSSHRQLFERIGKGALLTHGENFPSIKANIPEVPLRLLASENVRSAAAEFEPVSVTPDDIAFLQHSSGTTGLKKGVALSHQAVLRQVTRYAEAVNLSPQDRVISWLPLYHDMGLVACFLLPLVTQTPVVMLDPFEWVVNPRILFDAVKRYRGTLCWLPNFAFHHLCRAVRPSAGLDLSSMRAWIDCSEPCRAETFDLFERTFGIAGVKAKQLQVCYAMAETVFAVTQTAPGVVAGRMTVDPESLRGEGKVQFATEAAPHQSLLSAGRAISGLQLCIRHPRGECLPDGWIGEIAVAGDFLFDGYFELEEETRRKIRDGWYHTGDLGFLHRGELYVTGRKNDLIIVHGRNHYAHELEFIVNQIPGVHPGRSVAAGWFRPEIGSEDVVIVAEVDVQAEVARTRLIQEIKQALLAQAGLAVFDVHLVTAGWLVKTTSGKLSRTGNLEKYLVEISEAQLCAV